MLLVKLCSTGRRVCTSAWWGKCCFPPEKEVHPLCSASLLPRPHNVEDKAFVPSCCCHPRRRVVGEGDGFPSLQSQHKALQGFQPARDGELKAAVAMEIMHAQSSRELETPSTHFIARPHCRDLLFQDSSLKLLSVAWIFYCFMVPSCLGQCWLGVRGDSMWLHGVGWHCPRPGQLPFLCIHSGFGDCLEH